MGKMEKELQEEKVIEAQEAENKAEEKVDEKETVAEEKRESENVAAQTVQHQALQSQYIDKLISSLSKDDITPEDVQNVEFCKSEILSQLLGMTAFSMGLDKADQRKLAVDAVTSHLTKLYAKTAKLKEELARRQIKTVERIDVMEAKFGSGKQGVVTDEMLQPDFKTVQLALLTSIPGLSKALSLKDLVTNPTARLKSLLPDLLTEFDQKTSADDKQSYAQWANLLVEGLSAYSSKGAMLTALQGKGLSKMMKQLSAQMADK